MSESDASRSAFKKYSPVFWVVITLELLERGAYYGIMGYWPVHCMKNLGFSGTQFGILYAVLIFLLYFMPILASSLARKYGYKAILLVAFSILAPAYYVLAFVSSFYGIFLVIFAWGLGAGAFKPMISATIAEVTEKKRRNSAYSIYYQSINWGSLLAMVGVGVFIPEHFAHLTFLVGGVLITANLLITLVLFKNPIPPDPREKTKAAFTKLAKVLKDTNFTILLAIYAGFFLIFSSMHTFLPAYYVEFGIKPWDWFEAPLMSAINPLTIVMLGPILSKYMDRFESLKLMIAGMFLFSGGLFLLGMFPIWYIFALGIFIFSIGEFFTHPNFISYVSKIAPQEKVALYMGYAFLPSAVGQVLGSVGGGILYDNVAVNMERPSVFWAIYVVIGLISISNFLLYNRWINKKKGIVPKKETFFTSNWTNAGVVGVMILVLIAGWGAGITHYAEDEKEVVITPVDLSEFDLIESEPYLIQEYASENTLFETGYNISEKNVANVTFILRWTDEEDSGWIGPSPNHENQPDEFTLTTVSPDGAIEEKDSASNAIGEEGKVEFTVPVPVKTGNSENGTGIWNISVSVDAGDHEPRLFGVTFADEGNEFELEIAYEYYEKKG